MSEILNNESELSNLYPDIVQNYPGQDLVENPQVSKRETLLSMGFEASLVDQVLLNHPNEIIEDLALSFKDYIQPHENYNILVHPPSFSINGQSEVNELVQINCLICQSSFPFEQMLALDCNDQFCKACLFDYIKLRIVESQVLSMPCPNHECRVQIPDSLIKDQVSPDLFNKYTKFKEAEELFRNPYVRGCPKVDCEGYDIGSSERSKLTCNKCTFEYCFYCSEAWHDKEKCKNGADKQMDSWAKDHGLKFCPNCKRKVEKNFGCDHMTCVKCRYEWCWLCGEKYHSGHYDECEVKKLSKKNPPWAIVRRLFFAPFLIPFLCVVLCYVMTHKITTGSMGGDSLRRFVTRKKILSYFFATLIGLILSPVFFAIAPFALSIGLNMDCVRNHCCRTALGNFFGILIGLVTTPFLVICIILGAAVAHLLGILLILYKTYIIIRRCKDPQYFRPRNPYGYA